MSKNVLATCVVLLLVRLTFLEAFKEGEFKVVCPLKAQVLKEDSVVCCLLYQHFVSEDSYSQM